MINSNMHIPIESSPAFAADQPTPAEWQALRMTWKIPALEFQRILLLDVDLNITLANDTTVCSSALF